MSMFTKFLKNKVLLISFSFLILWCIANLLFFICSFTDYCILKPPIISDTNINYLPQNTCAFKSKNNEILVTKKNTKILIVTPKNFIDYKKYPLLVAFSPAGKTVKKSEKFYDNLTLEFTKYGFIIAYIEHLPQSEDSLKEYNFAIDLIKKNYCINDNISLLGHSDGGTAAALIAYRDNTNIYNKVIISAAGLNNISLQSETCPVNNTSYFIIHSKKDILFPRYGDENFKWLHNCFSCNEENLVENNCHIAKNCNTNSLKLCYTDTRHSKWPSYNLEIINFILQNE